jgi:nucleoside-diphosphate-sugar epimerase
MCEALVVEYSRRGWVQGLVLRLPMISVRPGALAAAASAFQSGIIREPLNGKAFILPIRDDGLEVWLSSPKMVVQNLIHAATLSLGTMSGQHTQQISQQPVISLPGVTITVADMLTALERVGGKQASSLVYREPNAGAERIVAS